MHGALREYIVCGFHVYIVARALLQHGGAV